MAQLGSRYEVLISAKIDPTQIQKQLDKFKGTVNITPKVNMSAKTIQDYVRQWNNLLERMQVGKGEIFNSPQVKKDFNEVTRLIADFGNGGKTSVKDVNLAFDDLRTSVAKNSYAMNTLSKTSSNFFGAFLKEIRIAIVRTIEWSLAMGTIYGALAKIREGFSYIIDLNKEMTNIQVLQAEGAQTDQEINSLANSYNKLAQEMGATTLEVAKGSTEWLRQGKTIGETQELLKATMMLSKLGAVESAQATEYLTSTLNGFKLEASQASIVVDKLVALDNNYATSVSEIAEALSRSANSAQQNSITFDELAAYITVVSSVTRKSAESIGESFKTMFARMSNIKLGKMFEDDATTLSDVERALSLVNIKLRESDTSFRDMSDVLDDVAAKWSTMNDVERSAVSNAIAGVRQRENFLVLMENYGEVSKAVTLQQDSLNLATERYGIYLDNIEAKMNRLKASWEELYQSVIKADGIKEAVEWMTALVKAVTNYSDAMKNASPLERLVSAIPAIGLPTFMGMETAKQKNQLEFKELSSKEKLQLPLDEIDKLEKKLKNLNILNALVGSNYGTNSLQQALTAVLGTPEELQKQIDDYKRIYSNMKDIFFAKEATGFDSRNFLDERLQESEEYIKKYKENMVSALSDISNTMDLITAQIVDPTEQFEKLNRNLKFLDEGFDSGKISTEEYFEELKNQIDGVDFSKMFGKDGEGLGEQFFAGLVTDTAGALELINKRFEEGKIGVHDYIDELDSFGGMLETISDLLLNNADLFGIQGEALDAMQSALGDAIGMIGSAREEMENLQELNQIVETAAFGLSTGELEQASTEYLDMMSAIANAAIATGQTFYDMQGNALTSAESIYQFLVGSQLNFDSFTQQLSGKNTSAIQNMVVGAGKLIEQLGKAISNFKAIIKFTPKIGQGLPINVLGKTLGTLPSLSLEVAASLGSGSDFGGIGQSLEQFGKDLQDYKPTDTNIFDYSTGLGNTSEAAKNASNNLKDFTKAGKEAAKSGGGSSKENNEALKAYNDLLKITIDMLKQKKKAEKDALKDELDAYKDIIDARKKLLEIQKDEKEHQDKIADKNKDILKLQSEILELQLDDSEEAKAKRLKLEEELAKENKELSDMQYDYSVDKQKEALDKEYEDFKKSIDDKIKAIDDYLAQSGTITREAIALLEGRSVEFYNELIRWNSIYGSGIDADITSKWNLANAAARNYANTVNGINGGGSGGSNSYDTGKPKESHSRAGNSGMGSRSSRSGGGVYHDGGIVGGKNYRESTEIFAKLLEGEHVSTPSAMYNFINKTLPAIASAGGGNVSFDNLINLNVQGNLDSSVLPEIENIVKSAVKELNTSLNNRGIYRNAKSYSV